MQTHVNHSVVQDAPPVAIRVLSPRQDRQGFTLLALLMVLVLLAGLAALALPFHLQYVARDQAIESLTFLGSLKGAVMEYSKTNHRFPDWDALRQISSVAKVSSGAGTYTDTLFAVPSWINPASTYTLVAHFRVSAVSEPLQKIASLYLQTVDGGKTWDCGPSALLDAAYRNYLPKICRTPITVQ